MAKRYDARKIQLPVFIIACVFFLLALSSANAEDFKVWGKPTEAEFKYLPPYCIVKIKNQKNQKTDYWKKKLGKVWVHMHHYCWGLNSLNRYYRKTKGAPLKQYLVVAKRNFDYMISASPPNTSLIPDFYLNRGITNDLAKNDSEALSDYLKALQLNPRLVKAYRRLADFYSKKNMNDDAIAIINKGLEYFPNNKSLERRLSKLTKEKAN